jgi:hypothetical protein
MRELNILGDNIVAFTSHQVDMDKISPPNSFYSPNRTPLAPSNVQNHVTPAASHDSIKAARMNPSPYQTGQSPSVSIGLPSPHFSGDIKSHRSSGLVQIKDENDRVAASPIPAEARGERQHGDAHSRRELTGYGMSVPFVEPTEI